MKKLLVILSMVLIAGNVWAAGEISSLTAQSDPPAIGDLMELVDISDTAMAPTGTNKKVTIAQIGLMVEVDGHTDATTLTASQVSGSMIYNTGQGAADVTINLPTAAVGLSFIGTVGTTVAANKWRFKAATNDKIYLIGTDGAVTAGSDAGYIGYSASAKYPTIGHYFTCWTFKTDAYDWICRPGTSMALTAE